MRKKHLVPSVLLLLTSIANAQSIYLKCTPVENPDLKIRSYYASPPKGLPDQFYSDMAEAGLLGVLLERAESWVINVKEGKITSPEENSGPPFTSAIIEETKIAATHTNPYGVTSDFHLNRVSGKLTYKVFLSPNSLSEWKATHGKALPSVWRWEMRCISASRPAI